MHDVQMMDKNTAAAAADASGGGSAGPAPADAASKPRVDYDEWRPEMVKVMTEILTEQMDEGKTKKFLKRARKTFVERVGKEASGVDVGYLGRDTLKRMREKGDVRNQWASGAPPKLAPEKRAQALHLLLSGNGKSGADFIGYASIQAAIDECEALRKIPEEAGITTRTLLRNLQDEYRERYGKKLKKITIHFKPKLSKEVKAERLATATTWHRWPLSKFFRIVWIDEKQEYLRKGGTYRCYAPPGMTSFISETDQALGKCPKLKYEAAVAGFCGPVYFKAITGTTKLNQGYRVRTVPRRTDFDPTCRRARRPCFIQDLHLVAAVSLCNPENTVALLGRPHADPLVLHALIGVVLLLAEQVMRAVPVDKQPSLGGAAQRAGLALKKHNVHAVLVHSSTYERAHLMHKLATPLADAVRDDVGEQAVFAVRQPFWLCEP